MVFTFNVVDRPWIPCLMPDGSTVELGLLEALADSHNIREVYDPSPLVTAAIYRLLLAVLHRNFGPGSINQWVTLWKVAHFDREVLEDYFQRWHFRLDLFDSEHPFYQWVGFQTNRVTPLKRLAFEFAAQNNPTLFDHSHDDERPVFPANIAARWVVANQAFAPTAGRSMTIHTKDSPLSRGAVVILGGENLFETLMLNLISQSILPERLSKLGIPTWESQEPFTPQHGATPEGYIEYLTWQSRAILLIPTADDSASIGVRECYYAQGKSLANELAEDEPMFALEETKTGFRAVRFREGRALWRDSLALLAHFTDGSRPPYAVRQLGILVESDRLPASVQPRLMVYGQCLRQGQPAIYFWRMERLALPLRYLKDDSLVEDLRWALGKTEDTSRAVRGAIRKLGSMLGHTGKTLSDLVDHLAWDEIYWSRLEEPFHRLLVDLPQNRDEVLDEWVNTLRRTAWQAFDGATRGFDQSARTLKALVEARQELGRRLHQVLTDR